MKQLLIYLSVLLSHPLLSQDREQVNLMPYPNAVDIHEGEYNLQSNFKVGIQNGTPRLYSYTTRFLRRLSGRTGAFLTQDKIGSEDADESASLFIRVVREGELVLGESESYTIDISDDGIFLKSETDFGAMRGLETLLQLLNSNRNGYYFPYVSIEDQPRFKWRGLLIDVCRHWMPMDVIKRNLDAMAAMKMNVLHLHLTEDQGFRIESKKFPALHEKGSNGNYYTQEQISEIVKYAGDRGIRVVPEFDMPGHTTSWFVGHPELASGKGPYTIETHYGVMDPAMNPVKESTYEFLEQFLGEMAGLFPDQYIHIGGDENNGKEWNANQSIQQFMSENGFEDNHALQTYFNERLYEILTKHGKKMMGWDEIYQPGVPKDIMIQSWRGKESLFDAANDGYQVILSNGYYIDLCWPAVRHYLNDPIPDDSPLSSDGQDLVLGGEATMWSELVTAETIDSRIWPRTAAIAERLWSPAFIDDTTFMYDRLQVISMQLEELGLTHIKNYEKMLRRLADSDDISSVKILVDILEPLENYERHSQGVKITTYSPMTRLADVARPESMIARNFNLKVDAYIKTGDNELKQELKDQLLVWVENHDLYIRVVESSPILKGSKSLSLDLSSIATIGFQALSDVVSHEDSWKESSYKVLDAAGKPRMECELKVISGIRKLVESAE